MNISLEEQIEYMRREVGWQHSMGKYETGEKMCQAILATLETVRDERKAKVTP